MPGDITTLCDFTFHEPTGGTLVDASGHGNHGHIHGASWQRINARRFCLSFDGSGFVRAPHDASLDLSDPFTISVWAKGHGGPLKWREMTSGDPPTRDPCFQVVGDKIYFATNTDIPHPHKRRRVAHHLLTGSVDTSGENWSVREHRFDPYSAVEPKMQVVGSEIHYGFFAVDRSQRDVTGTGYPGQFYTARSNLDGSDLRATPRLCSEEVGRRTEQSWLQVVGQRVYHAYVQMDDNGKWQLRTAQSDVDGGDWRSVQRTTAGGWVPRIQAAEGGIYYYYGRYHKTHPQDTFTIARSDYDGGNWEVGVDLHDDFARPWGFFLISDGWIYASYAARGKDGIGHSHITRLRVDGSERQTIRRADHATGSSGGHLRVMGDRLFHCYAKVKTPDTPTQYWLGESDLDGGNWFTRPVTDPHLRHLLNYGALQMVGGRTYWFANRAPDLVYDQRVVFGTSGSNLVDKGGAFGIGLTEQQRARAYVNGGPGHLRRGETMDSSYRHAIETEVDEDWHSYVMTSDGRTLTLFLDGDVVGTKPIDVPVERNDVPLSLGEGFVGSISRVTIQRGVDVGSLRVEHDAGPRDPMR